MSQSSLFVPPVSDDGVFDSLPLKTYDEIGSQLVLALESAYNFIRQSFPDGVNIKEYKTKPPVVGHVPEAVIVINSSPTKYGHFGASRWKVGDQNISEIMVGAEGLKRSSRAIIGTLLHEAVHGVCFSAGVQDCSNEGRYHNKAFKRTAEEMGLVVHEPVKVYGHTNTELPEGELDDLVDLIEPQIVAYREFDVAQRAINTNLGKDVSVRCRCPRSIRVNRNQLDQGPILCSVCGDEFV